jgi:hypothetical protein
MTTGYAQRLIDIVITAGPAQAGYTPPTFGPNKSNTLTLSGLRVSVTITNVGLVSMEMAAVQIFGMTLSDMNALSSLANPYYYSNHTNIKVLAGNAVDGMAIVFEGDMTSALTDFSDIPNVSFNVLAVTGFSAATDPIPASSYPGTVGIATICGQLAHTLGLTLENNGCTAVLSNQYLQGTGLDQLQRATTAAKVLYTIERGVLAIWPDTSFRTSQATPPVISPSTGLVGYPEYTAVGINFTTLYNPTMLYGANIQMTSSLKPACGLWTVFNMSHELDSMVPRGKWFTQVQACKPGLFPMVTSGGY